MIVLNDFSGGLNLRDSANEIARNETPDALNWTLDTRGLLRVRDGSQSIGSLPGTAGKPARIFYSEALAQWLCVRESAAANHLFTATTIGTWTDRGALNGSLGAGFDANFVDFPGATPLTVIALSGTGVNSCVYTWDKTTLTNVGVAQNIQGGALALWQNRVWLAAYPVNNASGNVTRLFASKIGDPATWDTATGGMTVDLRDKDAAPIRALGVAGGALIVFKARSAYRVSDSSTGAYSTIDAAAGSLNQRTTLALRGRLLTWGYDNIYEWDGVGPGHKVSDRLLPLFTGGVGRAGTYDTLIAGGVLGDRALFAYPSSTSSIANDQLLEVDPEHGWTMKHALVSTRVITSLTAKAGVLYGAVPTAVIASILTNVDLVYTVLDPDVANGNDAGSLPTNNYRTPWIQPAAGKLSRVIRAEVQGRLGTATSNSMTLNVYTDWDLTAPSLTLDLTSDLRAGDSSDEVEASIIYSLGHSRSFAFEFVAGTTYGQTHINSLSLDPIQIEA